MYYSFQLKIFSFKKTIILKDNLDLNPSKTMKKFKTNWSLPVITASLITMFLMPVILSAQDKPDFSGTWVLNESKSKFGEEGSRGGASQMVVTQQDNSITIVRTSQSRSGDNMTNTEKLTLDGQEVDNSTGNRTRKSKASWSSDGNSLNISSHMEFERNGDTMSLDVTEVWKLQDPKTLEVDYTSKSSRGERQRTYVYDKK